MGCQLLPQPFTNEEGNSIDKGGRGSAIRVPGLVDATITNTGEQIKCGTGMVMNLVNGAVDKMQDMTTPARAAKKAQDQFKKNLKHSKTAKFKQDKRHADDYLTKHGRASAEEYESKLERFVTSVWYEWLSISLIILNSFVIGAQTQYIGRKMLEGEGAGAGEEPGWVICHVTFCIIFSIDLGLRWTIDGFIVFFSDKG